MISSWFVEDWILYRLDAKAHHVIQVIGSSSRRKGQAFVDEHCQNSRQKPTVYGTHGGACQDASVDIVYMGLPHAFHKKACLDAIAAGKHLLCEKAFTINAKGGHEVFSAAAKKGVFVMEAIWLRFRPLVQGLLEKIHVDKIISDVRRVFCDFGMDMNIKSLHKSSKLKNPSLGAGCLLDIGIYPLTWGLLVLDQEGEANPNAPIVTAIQSLSDRCDTSSSMFLYYPLTDRQGILIATTETKTSNEFCRIEVTQGVIIVEGDVAAMPHTYTIFSTVKNPAALKTDAHKEHLGDVYQADECGKGFYHEADNVALEVAMGKLESFVMPHAKTIRVWAMMDEIRSQSGLKYP
jgi:predicted dehydrogenase